MTHDDIQTAARALLATLGEGSAKRDPEADSFPARVAHLRWLLGEVPALLAEGRHEKAMRWLAFCQGTAWAMGFRSVSAMKDDNRGEEELLPEAPPDRPADAVNPSHYRNHPSGLECVQITGELAFCPGNAVKYLWRLGQKAPAHEELGKAAWYLDHEAKRMVERKMVAQRSPIVIHPLLRRVVHTSSATPLGDVAEMLLAPFTSATLRRMARTLENAR